MNHRPNHSAWRYHFGLWITLMFVAVCAFGAVLEQRPFKRRIDPVTVSGRDLSALSGKKIENLGLFAVRNGSLQPIPFQIDERLNGRYCLQRGPQASRDADNGLLDADDELAFIATDGGPPRQTTPLPPGTENGLELELIDPVDGARNYVYPLSFSGRAPRSPVDYVTYHVAQNRIETTDYTVGYDAEAPISIDYLAVKPAIGGTGASVGDRQKIRIEADSFWNLLHLERNENDFHSQVLAYTDGPVRVIRETKIWQMIFWQIPTPSVRLTSTYWKTGMEFPIVLELPFNVAKWFRRAQMRIYVDSSPNIKGRRYYNSNNPAGVDIDGRMGEAERKLDPRPFEWQVVAGATPQYPEGWFSRMIYDRANIPVRLPLYYLDDTDHPDAPEHFPGCFGCLGFEFDGLEKLDAGKFSMRVQMFPMPAYRPGDEREYLQMRDQPIQIRPHPL